MIPSDLLFSAYPVSLQVRRRIEERCVVSFADTRSLGELKGLSPARILRQLLKMRAETLWILVSDHGYQPYLPLLRLLASLTHARRLRVVDFLGSSYPVTRVAVALRDPLRLAYWSLRGLWSVAAVRVEVDRLLRADRVEAALGDQPRIAYLKTNLWFGVQAGGSVGHVAGVANALSRSGRAVDAYVVEKLPMLDPEVVIHEIRLRNASTVPLELVGYVFQEAFAPEAARLIAERVPSFIYQRNCLANYAGVLLSRRFRVPLVLEYNGSEVWAQENWGHPLLFSATARNIEAVNLRHAHVIVVVSGVLRDELLRRGVPEQRVVFYPNCIDPLAFDPSRFRQADVEALRQRWDLPADAVVCLFLGTFGPWHGSDVLAEAVRRLAASQPGWLEERKVRFVFVGDGPLMPRLRTALVDVPAHLYRLTGLVPQQEAPLYLAAADIVLSPHVPNPDGTRFFGSPTKLFEYMAMGKAIIASELEQIGEVLAGSHHIGRQGTPASEEALRGSLALLTTPGSAEDLVTALEYLVPRPELRARLGGAARARALDRYTWERHVEAVLNRIEALEGALPGLSPSAERPRRPSPHTRSPVGRPEP